MDEGQAYARRELDIPATIAMRKPLVVNTIPGDKKDGTDNSRLESLSYLVGSGEVGLDVVRRALNGVLETKDTIARVQGECEGLVTSASKLPKYLELVAGGAYSNGLSEKPTLEDGKWQAEGKAGMVIWDPINKRLGLVISMPEEGTFVCRFEEEIVTLKNLGKSAEYFTMPDRTGPNALYEKVEFAELENISTPIAA
jgi:hypothetical protein